MIIRRYFESLYYSKLEKEVVYLYIDVINRIILKKTSHYCGCSEHVWKYSFLCEREINVISRNNKDFSIKQNSTGGEDKKVPNFGKNL